MIIANKDTKNILNTNEAFNADFAFASLIKCFLYFDVGNVVGATVYRSNK